MPAAVAVAAAGWWALAATFAVQGAKAFSARRVSRRSALCATTTTTPAEMFERSEAMLSYGATREVDGVKFSRYLAVGDENVEEEQREPLLYLPGIEFRGISFGAQLEGLAAAGFDPWWAWVEGDDRSSFDDLGSAVEHFLEAEFGGRRAVLVGESFGGLLALDVATRLSERPSAAETLRGVVLVNPATSFDRTAWAVLGRAVPAMDRVGSGGYAAAIAAAVGLLASDESMRAKSGAEFQRLDFSSVRTAAQGAQKLAALVPAEALCPALW